MGTTSGRLPKMRHEDGIRKQQTVSFGGLNHTLGARDGEIWAMKNMTSDHYPVLASRPPRYLVGKNTYPKGIYAHDGCFWAAGYYPEFIREDEDTGYYRLFEVTGAEKVFASLGAYIIILPDKIAYNRLTGEHEYIERTWTGSVTIQDGTYAGEEAKANTIYVQGANWTKFFRVGDAVTISGCTIHTDNNYTPIIREIDGDYLRFYENTFVINEGGDKEPWIMIQRTMPDMDFLIENENRLWGCKGDTIYASKLGDPFNWNVFDGLATDSYAVNVGSTGDFTAAFSYLGYPCFFKEEYIYKVYGYKPSNFQVMSSASLGVETGSHHSLAIAGEILFYLSRAGVVAYSGGIPQTISGPLGTQRYRNGVAGSDGRKYYISMQDQEDNWHLFVYDTEQKIWVQEDDSHALRFAWNGGLYLQEADPAGKVWLCGNPREIPAGATVEEPVESIVEFADFVEYSPSKKGVNKVQIRMETGKEASVIIQIQYDSDGVWHTVRTVAPGTKRSEVLPILPRRCDHYRLRFEGKGQWYLYALTREFYTGSDY